MRIQCPECETSYLVERLRIRVGPKEKAVIHCPVCNTVLRIEFRELPVVLGARKWQTLWLTRERVLELEPVVTRREGEDPPWLSRR